MATKRNISTYLGEYSNKTFVIPAYQRGFKWGVTYANNDSAATILFKNIHEALKANKQEYFIQGITVYEEGTQVVLIDGQQRTTVLFLLLSLLCTHEEKEKLLFYKGVFKLHYTIRQQSHKALESICKGEEVATDKNKQQDIFFFHQVIDQLKNLIQLLSKEEKEQFKAYVLDHVKLFYIKVRKDQAIKLFAMMNGAKAFMKTDELVKADILSKASQVDHQQLQAPQTIQESLEILKDQIGEDWKASALRSQFARQWDKWMYWWNRQEVKLFYNSDANPMGLLLQYFYERNNRNIGKKTRISYSNKRTDVAQMFTEFQNLFLQDKQQALKNFEALRKLQKRFEDIFNTGEIYNYFGLAHETLRSKEAREKTINYFLENYKSIESIKSYVLLNILDVKEMPSPDTATDLEGIKDILLDIFESLNETKVYIAEDKEFAFRLLLKLNVEAAIGRGVKFDFFVSKNGKMESLYANRSLEHIWPKSKIAFKIEQQVYKDIHDKEIENSAITKYLKEDDLIKEKLSQHHIGNLVLLHKNDNSTFNDKLPEDKKKVYFNLDKKLLSRNLLHTMSVFAYDNWSSKNATATIKSNQEKVLKLMKKGYEAYVN
ncbi:DUF262 domain-containing protein [uncultured Winogradskyella sp.]|uniref:DUF262 domain-containing protein n=1 Tax=uncultured Winogradskyella sp. TaxID=395353 RepID=UPI0026249FE7|nr:DUF262 domain-containing protein [uncultured Winogradskyella sp.]